MADMPVAFDTLKAATRLRDEAGFSEDQARVLVVTVAEAVVENLPTRQDLEGLASKADLAALRKDHATLRGEFAELRGEFGELRGEFAELRSDVEKKDVSLRGELGKIESTLRGEISKVQERLTLRMGAAVGTGVAILAVLNKIL